MLEKGVSDHRNQRMTVRALPGASLEAIETKFFLKHRALIGSRQGEQAGGRLVGEIAFLLSRHPVLADKPNLVPWQMLLTRVPDRLRGAICDSDSGKTSFELSFRSGAP